MAIRQTKNTVSLSLGRMRKGLAKVPEQTYDYFKSVTPIRSGNARRKTSLDKTTINANYPYARRLDTGYSRQAPQGMTKPTERFLKQLLRKTIRK